MGHEGRYSWVTTYLAVGAQPLRADLRALQRAGIGAVLNVRGEDDSLAERYAQLGVLYRRIPVADFGSPTPAQFDACCAFIDEQRAESRAVLVHCALGVGRSAAICLAFLMREGRSLTDALELLRAGRASASPSAQQLAAVLSYVQSITPEGVAAPQSTS